MFSEHLATAMAKAGGIGLAETILKQVQANQTKPEKARNFTKPLSLSTANVIKETKSDAIENLETKNFVESKSLVENKPLVENTSLLSPSVSAPSLPSSSSKVKLSASEVNQYVADLAKTSGRQQSNVVVEKAVNTVTKPKVQNSSNEMLIISEASEEDVTASKNYDYSSLNDSYLTRIYQQSGLADKSKTKTSSEQIISDKLPKTATPLKPIVTENIAASESLIKSKENQTSKVVLSWPLRGVVRSNFGFRKDPINGKHKFHQGLDIAAKRGTPIAAAADGVVVFAGWGKKYGNNVVIEHTDGRRTRYAHADKLFVTEGETITKGQKIAAVGSTGRATGPHLHFEVIENGRNVNPLKILANDIQLVRR